MFQTLANAKERWWTFAGLLGNATILGILGPHLEQPANYDNLSIVLPESAALQVRQAMDTGQLDLSGKTTPQVDKRAIEALKFSECLPSDLLDEVVTARWSDHPAATAILSQPNALVQEA